MRVDQRNLPLAHQRHQPLEGRTIAQPSRSHVQDFDSLIAELTLDLTPFDPLQRTHGEGKTGVNELSSKRQDERLRSAHGERVDEPEQSNLRHNLRTRLYKSRKRA